MRITLCWTQFHQESRYQISRVDLRWTNAMSRIHADFFQKIHSHFRNGSVPKEDRHFLVFIFFSICDTIAQSSHRRQLLQKHIRERRELDFQRRLNRAHVYIQYALRKNRQKPTLRLRVVFRHISYEQIHDVTIRCRRAHDAFVVRF